MPDNNTSIRSAFDIELGPRPSTGTGTRQGYMLAYGGEGPALQIDLQEQPLPRIEDEQVSLGQVPGDFAVTWDDWSLGMGYEYPSRKMGHYAWAKGVWAGQEGVLVLPARGYELTYPGGSSPAVDVGWLFADEGNIYISKDRLYSAVLGATGALALSDTHTGGIPQSMVRYKNRYYVGSTSTFFRQSSVGPPLSWSSGPNAARHFAIVGNRLYRVSDTETLSFTTDDGLQAADWEGSFSLGDTSETTRRLLATGLLLFAARENGLFGQDTLGNIFPLFNIVPASENAWGADAEGAYVYLPYKGGLVQYQVQGQRDNLFFPTQTRERRLGDFPRAISVSENGNVYIAAQVRDTTGGSSVKGYHILLWNPKRRALHSLYYKYATGYQVGAIKFAPGSTADGYVYWTAEQGTSTPRVVFQSAPEPMAYWKREPVGDVELTGEIAFSMHDAGFPGVLKNWRTVELFCEDIDDSPVQQVDVYYRTDFDSAWTLLGSTSTLNGHLWLFFGGAAGSGITSEYLQLRLVLSANNAGANTTESPAVRKVVLRGTLLAGRHQVFTLRLMIDDNVVNRDGAPDSRSARDISSDLVKLFTDQPETDSSVRKPMQMVDLVLPDGQVHTCVPLSYVEAVSRIRIGTQNDIREQKTAILKLMSTGAINSGAW